MPTVPIKRVTIYYGCAREGDDARNLLSFIEKYIIDNFKFNNSVSIRTITRDSLSEEQLGGSSSLLFLRHWEKESADVYKNMVDNEVPFFSDFEVFITESEPGVTPSSPPQLSGETAYAIYKKQIPVILFSDFEKEKSMASEALLLWSYARLKHINPDGKDEVVVDDSAERRVQLCKLFLDSYKRNETNVISYEHIADTSSTLVSDESMVSRILSEHSGSDVYERVFVLRNDGYPLHLPDDSTKIGRETLVIPKRRIYEHLTETILSKPPALSLSNGDVVCRKNFYDLLQYNNYLLSSLFSFQRYENRGLYKYILLLNSNTDNGRNLVAFVNHSATVLQELFRLRTAASMGSKEGNGKALFTENIITVRSFEEKWLDVLLPHTFYFICADDSVKVINFEIDVDNSASTAGTLWEIM